MSVIFAISTVVVWRGGFGERPLGWLTEQTEKLERKRKAKAEAEAEEARATAAAAALRAWHAWQLDSMHTGVQAQAVPAPAADVQAKVPATERVKAKGLGVKQTSMKKGPTDKKKAAPGLYVMRCDELLRGSM